MKSTVVSKNSVQWSRVESPLGGLRIEWTSRGLKSVAPFTTEPKINRVSLGIRTSIDEHSGQANPSALVERTISQFFQGHKIKLNEFDSTGWSDFQRSVYAELLKVQPGQTTNYATLAQNSGHPGAARAVGTAMSSNPIPLLVPCHRVLPSTPFTLGRYSFGDGVSIKARLLNFEAWKSRTGKVPYTPYWEFDWIRAQEHLTKHIPIGRRRGILQSRLNGSTSLFLTLARSIVGQQIHPNAAAAVWGRLQEYGDEAGFRKATVAQLRACGASERKAESLRALAEACLDNRIPTLGQAFFLSNDELIERITQIKGIGPWTVQMILIFQLGRADIWPIADFGMRRGMEKFLGSRQTFTPDKMRRLESRFAPYQTAASLYFWDYHGRHL